MWETTFPRNSHAGLGKPIHEDNIPRSMHETSLSTCPIRRGYCMLPKRRFWKIEQSVACAFLNDFSMTRRPYRALTPVESTSKMHTQRFVRVSKIFVWGAYISRKCWFPHGCSQTGKDDIYIRCNSSQTSTTRLSKDSHAPAFRLSCVARVAGYLRVFLHSERYNDRLRRVRSTSTMSSRPRRARPSCARSLSVATTLDTSTDRASGSPPTSSDRYIA